VPIRSVDEEAVAISINRRFLAFIDRSRAREKKAGRNFRQGTVPSGNMLIPLSSASATSRGRVLREDLKFLRRFDNRTAHEPVIQTGSTGTTFRFANFSRHFHVSGIAETSNYLDRGVVIALNPLRWKRPSTAVRAFAG